MTHKITIHTKDGKTVDFECEDHEDLVTAACSKNINMPSQCRQGGCGACGGNVINDGKYEMGEINQVALPKGEHPILMCRTFAKSDLNISVPYDSGFIRFAELPKRKTIVSSKEMLNASTIRLSLTLVDEGNGVACEFEPGQFMEIELPDGSGYRAYSLSNVPNWGGELEFLIRLQQNGKFSEFLRNECSEGAVLNVRGPSGTFCVDQNSLSSRWLIAGGTGVAPLLSFLRRMEENQDMFDTHLFFGVNTKAEVFMEDELKRLKDALPSFKYTICVAQEEDGCFHGTPVDAALHSFMEKKANPDVYLCGPGGMIDGFRKVFNGKISEGKMHWENFSASN